MVAPILQFELVPVLLAANSEPAGLRGTHGRVFGTHLIDRLARFGVALREVDRLLNRLGDGSRSEFEPFFLGLREAEPLIRQFRAGPELQEPAHRVERRRLVRIAINQFDEGRFRQLPLTVPPIGVGEVGQLQRGGRAVGPLQRRAQHGQELRPVRGRFGPLFQNGPKIPVALGLPQRLLVDFKGGGQRAAGIRADGKPGEEVGQ